MLEDLGNAFLGLSVLYLLWYGWQVFVKDGGDLGGLGLGLAVIACLELIGTFLGAS